MNLKDSFGNEIPIGRACNSSASTDEVLYQLQLTYFHIAIGLNLEKGHKVLYDKNSKKAIITKKDGEKVKLEHN